MMIDMLTNDYSVEAPIVPYESTRSIGIYSKQLNPLLFVQAALSSTPRKDLISHLANIAKLHENWDSLGGSDFSEGCIKNTENIILGLYPEVASPEMYPNPNGTITLDWELDEQLLSIEIGDTHYSAYWENNNDTTMDSAIFTEKMPSFLFIALQYIYQKPKKYAPSTIY